MMTNGHDNKRTTKVQRRCNPFATSAQGRVQHEAWKSWVNQCAADNLSRGLDVYGNKIKKARTR